MIKLNGHPIKPTIFPDKTSQVWKLEGSAFIPFTSHHLIEWIFESESELFHLKQLVDLLKEYPFVYPITLYLDYLPYARQDKRITNETTFALHSFLSIIDYMNFESINVLDPHSVKTCDIVGFNSISPYAFLKMAFDNFNPDYICFPDQSSSLRYEDEIETISMERGVIYKELIFNKVRDQDTGNILYCELTSPDDDFNFEENRDKKVLIIDDICDGGATFIHCSTKLYSLGFKKIALYVTHGLFTKGFDDLKKAGISEFYSKKGKHDV